MCYINNNTGFAKVLENLESPGIWKFGFQAWKVLEFFLEVLESPEIWTCRYIFLIISIQEFSHYTSSEIWVYLCALKVLEFIENVLEFDNGRSWNLRCQNVYEPDMGSVPFCQFHSVNSNSTSNLSIPIQFQFQNVQFQCRFFPTIFFTMTRYSQVPTWNTYSK